MAGVEVTGDTDVILKVGESFFPSHRKILSQSSPYFQAMFGHNFIEKDQSVIEIQNVEPEAMKSILEYVKTNEIPRDILKSTEILSLLQASSMLQFEDVQEICVNVIVKEWLSIETCLQTMATAHDLEVISLYRKARALAFWEFSKVKSTSAFFDLSIDALESYLDDDGLNPKQGEFEVFDAGLSWLQEDPENRKQHILRILACVRFSDLSASDIRTMFLYPNVNEDPQALNLLHCVLKLKNDDSSSCSSKIFQSAINSKATSEVQTTVGQDANEKSFNANVQKKRCCCSSLKCLGFCKSERRNSDTSSYSTLDNNSSCRDNSRSVSRSLCRDCSSNSSNNSYCSHSKSQESPSKSKEGNEDEFFHKALHLLSKPARQLPIAACVIGHKNDSIPKDKIMPRAKSYAIYFDDKLKQPVPFVYLTKINDGPMEPTGYKVISKGQDLYVIGGEYLLGYGRWNCTVWKYSMWQDQWYCETSLQDPRRHHSVCIIDDDIYVIGGFGRHRVIMNAVEKYNVSTKLWSRRAPLPTTMYSAACCVHKGFIYVFGVENCYYHVKENTWYTFNKPVLPGNITFSSAMSYGDNIFLVGAYTSELMRFSPELLYKASNSSEDEESFEVLGTFKYHSVSACLANGKIYSFSANDQGHIYVEMYDILSKEFHVLWKGSDKEPGSITDFNPKNCIGCFPIVMY